MRNGLTAVRRRNCWVDTWASLRRHARHLEAWRRTHSRWGPHEGWRPAGKSRRRIWRGTWHRLLDAQRVPAHRSEPLSCPDCHDPCKPGSPPNLALKLHHGVQQCAGTAAVRSPEQAQRGHIDCAEEAGPKLFLCSTCAYTAYVHPDGACKPGEGCATHMGGGK